MHFLFVSIVRFFIHDEILCSKFTLKLWVFVSSFVKLNGSGLRLSLSRSV